MSQRNIDVTHLNQSGERDLPPVCSVLEVLDQISGKWNIGVLLQTINGPIRYTELERAVKGISRRMLTLTLRNLERDGLIVRKVYPTVPPKVEYTATEIACELHDSLLKLTTWAEHYRGVIAQSRNDYDARTSQNRERK